MNMNPAIDKYLSDGCMRCSLGATPECKVHKWTDELKLLRKMVLECGYEEKLKWGVPCYTFQSNNVLIISAFKTYCSISFFKGVLLKDSASVLIKPGESSQAARLLKFTSVQEIVNMEATIMAYLVEAIAIEQAGLKVAFKKNPEPIPDELLIKLDEDPTLKTAFESLTSGRQRGYILHFSQPKQSATRTARIEKCIPKILNGEGLNDKYKSMKKNN